MLEQQANGYGGQGQKLSGAGKSGVAVAPHGESTVQEMGVSGGLLASLGEAGRGGSLVCALGWASRVCSEWRE